jgi:hypothetical protein
MDYDDFPEYSLSNFIFSQKLAAEMFRMPNTVFLSTLFSNMFYGRTSLRKTGFAKMNRRLNAARRSIHHCSRRFIGYSASSCPTLIDQSDGTNASRMRKFSRYDIIPNSHVHVLEFITRNTSGWFMVVAKFD